MRLSVVLDELSVVSNDRNEADGPAFYVAIDRLNQIKAQESSHWLQVSFVANTETQPLMDSLFSLLSALTEDWTDRQREIVWGMNEPFPEQNVTVQ